jgi:hypothetical protein
VVVAMGVGVFVGFRLNRSATTIQQIFPDDGGNPTQAGGTNGGTNGGGALSFPLAGKILPPPPGELYWGAFRNGAPYNTGLVIGLEDEVGRRPAIMSWYQEWEGAPDFPVADASYLYDRGIVPMVSWEPWRPPKVFGTLEVDQPKYRLARIAGGAFDDYIRRYAGDIRDYGGPVFLRPFHEMDGFWYPWGGTVNNNTPADYVAAWRHVHDLFREVGATNVTWIWSVNHVTVPDTPENQIQHYWPGPAYVDWIGVSGFNWGTASPLSTWKGFDAVNQDKYRQLLAYHLPIMLTETGAPEVGGVKAEWITDSFHAMLDHYPQLRAVIWYDKRDSDLRDWRLDSTPAALAAFRAAVSNPDILSANAAQATAIRDEHG